MASGCIFPVNALVVRRSALEQVLLIALRELGSDSIAALRDLTWARLKAQNKRLLRDGKPLESEADNIAEVEWRVGRFLDRRLPLLRRLGAIPA